MRYLVTGGSGFIGRHLASALIRRGDMVRVATRLRPQPLPDGPALDADWVKTDLCDTLADWRMFIQDCDVVYHLAWTTVPATSNPDPLRDARENVLPSVALLEAERKQPAGASYSFVRTKRSTGRRGRPVNEDHPANPVCAYGVSKMAVETYLAFYRQRHGVDYRVLYVANPFGFGQDSAGRQDAVTAFLLRAIAGQPAQIWGDGSVVPDHVHISDVVRALLKAADIEPARLGPHRIFKIGSGTGRCLNDVVAALRALGLDVALEYRRGRSFDVPVNVLDVTRAPTLLTWVPRLNFDEALSLAASELGWTPVQERSLASVAQGA